MHSSIVVMISEFVKKGWKKLTVRPPKYIVLGHYFDSEKLNLALTPIVKNKKKTWGYYNVNELIKLGRGEIDELGVPFFVSNEREETFEPTLLMAMQFPMNFPAEKKWYKKYGFRLPNHEEKIALNLLLEPFWKSALKVGGIVAATVASGVAGAVAAHEKLKPTDKVTQLAGTAVAGIAAANVGSAISQRVILSPFVDLAIH